MTAFKANPRLSAWRGWSAVLLLPAAVAFGTPRYWPRWLFMWLLAVAIFAACKWLTWRRTPVPGVPLWREACYLFAWPGLDARTFLAPGAIPSRDRPRFREWIFACTKLLLGVFIFWEVSSWIPRRHILLLGWLGMVGLILMLHFGAFHVLSCGWRTLGIEARPLMDNPAASVSVGEFWSKRWNTAFRDVTHRFLFRPLAKRCGPRCAAVGGFLVSGLVHELVISVPAGGGYGGPTLFFLIQAAALLFERTRTGQTLGLGQGWRGWVFTMSMLAAPVYWLFHPPFVLNVMVPFMDFLGAGGSP